MSKNMTKKGLAISAAIGLSVAGLGLPAQAAIGFTTAPISGTSTGAVLGTAFVLQTTVANADATNIKYLLTGLDDETDLDTVLFELEDSVAGNDAGDFSGATLAADVVEQLDGSEPVVLGNASQLDATAANPYIQVALGLNTTNVTTETTITVTPFTDANEDGVFDSALGEVKGSSFSVTFFPADKVTLTASQTVDVVNSDVTVTASIDNVNNASIVEQDEAHIIDVDVLVNGTATSDAIAVADFDADNAFEVTTSISSGGSGSGGKIGSGDIVVTKLTVVSETKESLALTTNTSASDAASFEDATDADQDTPSGGHDEIRIARTNSFFLATNTSNDVLRSGAGSFTASVVVLDSDSDGVSGETVTWKISESNATAFDSKVSISAGGKTLKNTKSTVESITVDAVTNADGEAFITVTYAGFDDGNQFELDADVKTAGLSATARTLTAQDPLEYNLAITNTDDNGSIVVDENSSMSLNVSLRDEFGQAPDSNVRFRYVFDSSIGTAEDITGLATLDGNGNAVITATTGEEQTYTFGLTNATVATITTTNAIDVMDSDGDYGNAFADLSALNGQNSVEVVDGPEAVTAVEFVSTESQAKADKAAISGTTLYSNDFRVAGSAELAATTTAASSSDSHLNAITAKVTDKFGVAVEGAAVSFSASDLEFTDEAGEIQSVGSITVVSDANGKVFVGVLSNVAGDHTVTASSNGKTDTLVFSVENSTTNTDLAKWTVTPSGGAVVKAGSTLSYVAVATDKYGNYIDLSGDDGISLSYTGPGIVIPNDLSAIDSTDSLGQVKLSVAFGSNDSGSGSVTVSGDNNTASDKTDDIVAAIAFTIGDAPAGDYGTLKAWTVDQGDGTAKVYVKYPTLGDKVRIGHQTGGSGSYETIFVKTIASESDSALTVNAEGYYIVRTINLDSGTNRIRVTVGDNTEVQVRYNE